MKITCLSCKRCPNIKYRIGQKCELCKQFYGILCGTKCVFDKHLKYLNKHLEENHRSIDLI